MNLHTLLQDSIPYLEHYGFLVTFSGAILEGETVVILIGVLCHRGVLPFEGAAIAAALGAYTGDQFWFRLGRRYGDRILLRFPRLKTAAQRVEPWVTKNADRVAMSSRYVYGTRIISPILLGMSDYSAVRFAAINGVAASLWGVLFVSIGYFVSTGAEQIFGRIERIEHLLLSIIVIMLLRRWYRLRVREK